MSSLVSEGKLSVDSIDEKVFGSCLSTDGAAGKLIQHHHNLLTLILIENRSIFLLRFCVTDPEILIRTSGEYRISNFLLWQLAYTEMFFLDKFWPEVTQNDLLDIFSRYAERNRRFGK